MSSSQFLINFVTTDCWSLILEPQTFFQAEEVKQPLNISRILFPNVKTKEATNNKRRRGDRRQQQQLWAHMLSSSESSSSSNESCSRKIVSWQHRPLQAPTGATAFYTHLGVFLCFLLDVFRNELVSSVCDCGGQEAENQPSPCRPRA